MKTNSKFKIFMQTDLANSDYKVLALLYQPLIGMKAYSLHATFYQLSCRKQNEILHHQVLLDVLNIKPKEFIKLRERLEAVGLMETYKDDDLYYYMLKPPYSAKQFLLDTILGTYLESEIGEANLDILANIFKVKRPDISSFENISKSFDDLYQFKQLNLLNLGYEIEGRNGDNNKLIRKSIDYDRFVDEIPRAYKSPSLLNSKFKEQIMQIAFVYQFNLDQMLEVYENAHRGRSHVTASQINFQAKQLYEKNNEQVIVEENLDDPTLIIQNATYNQIVQKFGNQNFAGQALSTVNEFITRNDIDSGILNVLLMFILKNKDGILPNVNYLDKVWQSWLTNGVQTIEDAISHKDNLEKQYSTYRGNNVVKRDQPEWLDEYIKEIEDMEG